MTEDNNIMTLKEAAKYLCVSPHTLRNWRKNHVGPDGIKYENGQVRYRKEKLNDFISKWEDK